MHHNHRLGPPPTDSAAHWATMSDPAFDAGQVSINLGISFDITDKPFLQLIERFITALKKNIDRLEPYQVQGYYDSCKARYSELYKLMNRLLDLSQNYEVVLTRANGKCFIRESIETEIHFISAFDDTQDEIVLDLTLKGHPKIYGFLTKAIVRAMICLGNEGYSPEDYPEALLPYLQVILSVGALYDDLRGDNRVIASLEEKALEGLLLEPVQLNLVKQLWPAFLKDLEKGRNAPPYIRDIARVIPWVDKTLYSPDDFHISLRSTGTSKGGKSLNGLAASVYEVDCQTWKCDPIIGYKSYYRTDRTPGIKQYDRKTITIEQHKLKRRVIHMASNPIQDRCNWFHRRIVKILRRIDSDCTFNQDAGRLFARTETAKALDSGRNIYSADISDATGTISPEFQEMVISLFFGQELAEAWSELTRGTSKFCFHNRKEVEFTPLRGQFQGYKSSFPAFALAHHILMRLVMMSTGHSNLFPKQFYRILGDDSIVSVMDHDLRVMNQYEALAKDIGWDINRSKGYYYFADKEPLPVAEFAKVRYCLGRALSPLPLMLTLGLSSPNGMLPAILFISKHLSTVSAERLIRVARASYIELYKMYYILLLVNNKLGPWANITPTNNIPELSASQKSTLLIHYFRSQLLRTTLGLWLPSEYEGNLTEKWTTARKNAMVFLEFAGVDSTSAASLDTRHKIWYLMDKQDSLIRLIEQVIGDANLSYAGLGLDLSPEDESILEQACEITSNYKEIDPDILLEIIPKAISILSRFNPRSDSLNSFDEFSSNVVGGYAIDCIEDLEILPEQIEEGLALLGYNVTGEEPDIESSISVDDIVVEDFDDDEQSLEELLSF